MSDIRGTKDRVTSEPITGTGRAVIAKGGGRVRITPEVDYRGGEVHFREPIIITADRPTEPDSSRSSTQARLGGQSSSTGFQPFRVHVGELTEEQERLALEYDRIWHQHLEEQLHKQRATDAESRATERRGEHVNQYIGELEAEPSLRITKIEHRGGNEIITVSEPLRLVNNEGQLSESQPEYELREGIKHYKGAMIVRGRTPESETSKQRATDAESRATERRGEAQGKRLIRSGDRPRDVNELIEQPYETIETTLASDRIWVIPVGSEQEYQEMRRGLEQRATRRERRRFLSGFLKAFGAKDDMPQEEAVSLVEDLSDEDLELLFSTPKGRHKLLALYHAITSDNMSEDWQEQANRILAASARQSSIQDFANRRDQFVFPIRQGILVWQNAEPDVQRLANGKIRVTFNVGSYYYREAHRLPPQAFTNGITLDPSQPVRLKLYDQGGKEVIRPALYLIEIDNRGIDMARDEFVATMLSAVGGGLVRGAILVAEANFVRLLARWGSLGRTRRIRIARQLIRLQKTQTVRILRRYGPIIHKHINKINRLLPRLNQVVKDNQSWLISEFGDVGKKIVESVDFLDTAAGYYGLVDVVLNTGKMAAIKQSYGSWSDKFRSRIESLSAEDRMRGLRLSAHLSLAIDSIDKLNSAIKKAKKANDSADSTAEESVSMTGEAIGIDEG